MSNADVDVLDLDPEDQLTLFSRSSLLKTFIISALIHVLLIGGSKAATLLETDQPKPVNIEAGDGSEEPPGPTEADPGAKPPPEDDDPAGLMGPKKDPKTDPKEDPKTDPKKDPKGLEGVDPKKREKHEGVTDPATTPIDPFNLK